MFRFMKNVVCCFVMAGGCFGMQDIFITSREGSVSTYSKCESSSDIRYFIGACRNSATIKIGEEHSTICEAVETIIDNTMSPSDISSLDDEKKSLVVSICFIALQQLDSIVYPATILKQIAPTDYDVANFILKSQCDESYTPIPTADWRIIGDAIYLLKNVEKDEANQLLQSLKNVKEHGCSVYGSFFGDSIEGASSGKWDPMEDGDFSDVLTL